MWAAMYSQVGCVSLLLDRGAQPNLQDKVSAAAFKPLVQHNTYVKGNKESYVWLPPPLPFENMLTAVQTAFVYIFLLINTVDINQHVQSISTYEAPSINAMTLHVAHSLAHNVQPYQHADQFLTTMFEPLGVRF